MLRIHILGASALAVVAFAGTASAADIPRAPAPPAQPVVTIKPPPGWGGVYVGVLGGYGWGSGTVKNNGWIGGAYAGYNVEVNRNIVLGVEADGTLTNKSGSNGATTVSNPWDATLRGRIGFANQMWMVYGTGGLAMGQVKASTGGVTESTTRTGWTVGAGVEALLTGKTTARVEYRFTDLGTATFASNPPITYRSNDILVGIGLKF